jgi:hypothetical protein
MGPPCTFWADLTPSSLQIEAVGMKAAVRRWGCALGLVVLVAAALVTTPPGVAGGAGKAGAVGPAAAGLRPAQVLRRPLFWWCCPGPPGRLSALSIFLCKLVFYGIFV